MIYNKLIEEFKQSEHLVTEPQSFRDYSESATGKSYEPWPYISIDSVSGLRAELKAANMMVLRLGVVICKSYIREIPSYESDI